MDDCLAKLWESSTVEASKSEWKETWANQNQAPWAKRDHLIWEHHGQEDEYVRLSCWGQIPNRWKTLMWKREHLGREDSTYFGFTYAVWALLFVSFIVNIVLCVCTHRSDSVILKINFFVAILAPKCIPGLFLAPTCSFFSCYYVAGFCLLKCH